MSTPVHSPRPPPSSGFGTTENIVQSPIQASPPRPSQLQPPLPSSSPLPSPSQQQQQQQHAPGQARQKRNRAALRDYYGIKQTASSASLPLAPTVQHAPDDASAAAAAPATSSSVAAGAAASLAGRPSMGTAHAQSLAPAAQYRARDRDGGNANAGESNEESSSSSSLKRARDAPNEATGAAAADHASITTATTTRAATPDTTSASAASTAGDSMTGSAAFAGGVAAAAAGESEIDRDGFSAQEYVAKLLSSGNLEALLKAERKLLDEIKALDGERKALVYDNYSKLIATTETIRKMRANMDPLRITTETLEPTIAHIADTVTKLHERDQKQLQQRQLPHSRISGNSHSPSPPPGRDPAAAISAGNDDDDGDGDDRMSSLHHGQTHGEQNQAAVNEAETASGADGAAAAGGARPTTADSMVDSADATIQQRREKQQQQQQRQQQRQAVRRALDTPRRIRALMRAGRRDSALREWHAVARVLDGEWRGVEGVDALRGECERALKEET